MIQYTRIALYRTNKFKYVGFKNYLIKIKYFSPCVELYYLVFIFCKLFESFNHF